MHISQEDLLIRLVAAMVLSALIGLERQFHGKPAGLRTHALAGLGAAIMTLSGVIIADQTEGVSGIATDPTRMASIVIQGIGFIGAGVIIQSKGFVKGITSATTLWFVAAIGIATGFGLWLISIVSTALALILLVLFRRFEEDAEKSELLHFMREGNTLTRASESKRKQGKRKV